MAAVEINLITAGQANFLVYEGDTPSATLSFSDTDTGVPVDFSAAEITMEIRAVSGSALVETFSTTSDDINYGGAGHNVLTITGWKRLPYVSAGYKYDLQSKIGSIITTWLVGKITITEEITEVA